MKIKNAQKVTISIDRDHYHAHIGATQLKNGDVIVLYNETRGRKHEDFDTIKLIRSKDSGETWDPSTRLTVCPQTDYFGADIPSITQLSDGTLLVNFLRTSFVERKGILEDLGPQSENLGLLREVEGTWLIRSTDNGYTWGTPYKANATPLRHAQPIDGVVELPNGTLLMAVLGQMVSRYWKPEPEPGRSALLRSDNKGLDWEHYATIAYDPAGIISFDEPALGRTRDGILVCMMRTSHAPRQRHEHLWFTYSKNNGESWSRPEPTNLWGYPADLTLLRDGRMLCTYGYRRPPWGVRGCISDDGLHWDIANEFVVREGGVAPPSAERGWWHIGYPETVQLKNGRILTVDHQFSSDEPLVQFVVGVLYEV